MLLHHFTLIFLTTSGANRLWMFHQGEYTCMWLLSCVCSVEETLYSDNAQRNSRQSLFQGNLDSSNYQKLCVWRKGKRNHLSPTCICREGGREKPKAGIFFKDMASSERMEVALFLWAFLLHCQLWSPQTASVLQGFTAGLGIFCWPGSEVLGA